MRFTPPVQTLYALKQAILEVLDEGVENRYRRYTDCWEILTNGLRELNIEYLVSDELHSKIITSVQIPKHVDFNEMHDYFYELGFTIYPGKDLKFNTFRIANIGDINSDDIKRFLNLFKLYLHKTNILRH